MKKTMLWLLLMCAGMAQAAGYGILVNGTTYFAAEYRGKDSMTGTYDEYLAHVKVQNGDYLQLYDVDYEAAWVFISSSSTARISCISATEATVAMEKIFTMSIREPFLINVRL